MKCRKCGNEMALVQRYYVCPVCKPKVCVVLSPETRERCARLSRLYQRVNRLVETAMKHPDAEER